MSLVQVASVSRERLRKTLERIGVPKKLAYDVSRRLPYKTADRFAEELLLHFPEHYPSPPEREDA